VVLSLDNSKSCPPTSPAVDLSPGNSRTYPPTHITTPTFHPPAYSEPSDPKYLSNADDSKRRNRYSGQPESSGSRSEYWKPSDASPSYSAPKGCTSRLQERFFETSSSQYPVIPDTSPRINTEEPSNNPWARHLGSATATGHQGVDHSRGDHGSACSSHYQDTSNIHPGFTEQPSIIHGSGIWDPAPRLFNRRSTIRVATTTARVVAGNRIAPNC
jgi:hypothetical protein